MALSETLISGEKHPSCISVMETIFGNQRNSEKNYDIFYTKLRGRRRKKYSRIGKSRRGEGREQQEPGSGQLPDLT